MEKRKLYIWLILALLLVGCSRGIDEYVRQSRHVDVDVRVYGVEKLGKSGQLDAVPHLIQALKDEKARVRLAAIDALGQIGDSTSVDVLCSQMQSEISQVRWVSAVALGRIGSPRAIGPLANLLGDEEMRQTVLFALDQIDKNWRARPEVEMAVERFRRDLMQDDMLGDKQAVIRFRALEGLNAVVPDWREKDWADGLVMHWCRWVTEGNDDERKVAARFLGDLKDQRAVQALIVATEDQDRNVRRQAIQSLGKMRDMRAAGVLRHALVGEDRYVRGVAARALGALRDTSAVELLISLVDREMHLQGRSGEEMMASIARALGVLNDRRGIDALIRLLGHPGIHVRRSAVESLGQIGDLRTTNALAQALNDSSVFVRWSAAWALVTLKDARVVPTLVEMLGKGANVQMAVSALRDIEPDWRNRRNVQEKIDAWISTFENGKGVERIVAAMRLSEIGGERVVEVLKRALRERELDVIAAAHPFFIREYSAFATSALVQALEHEGDERMASAMLASGNPKLAKAARHWAYARGMALVSPPER
ncbi:MAG: HEAT repeat domain-containing protein [Gemmatimonadetes bacterium]|nr:HEAT repeat domain-containing protein [Gemmatimonadota bacterium]